jgi:hypothetical protein
MKAQAQSSNSKLFGKRSTMSASTGQDDRAMAKVSRFVTVGSMVRRVPLKPIPPRAPWRIVRYRNELADDPTGAASSMPEPGTVIEGRYWLQRDRQPKNHLEPQAMTLKFVSKSLRRRPRRIRSLRALI